MLTSAQGHYSVEKACIASGLGKDAVVEVACDRYGAIDLAALRKTYDELMADPERYPFFINATAGTTVMGSFDDLTGLSAFAREKGMYLHVDGSWGGPVLFSDAHSGRVRGIEHADSLTMNPHKLLNVPIQCSFLVFREGKKLFAGGGGDGAAYLFHSANVLDNPGMKTLGCGRRSDAVKFYLYWLKHGRAGIGAHVDKGIALAERVNQLVASKKDTLQLHAGPREAFLQVCFRPYSRDFFAARPSLSEAEKNQLLSQAARTVRDQLQAEKMFLVDFAPLPENAGDFVRLVVHSNTKYADLQTLVERIEDLGQRYFQALPPA